MNYIEKTNRTPRFVCLQVANEMPARSVPSQLSYLVFGFLNAILSQVMHAQLQRRFQRFDRVRFSNGDQSYLLRRPATGSCRCLNSRANVRESVVQPWYWIWFRQHPFDNTIEMKL